MKHTTHQPTPPAPFRLTVGPEIFAVGHGGASALLTETADTTTVFDDLTGDSVRSRPVPGLPEMRYIPFGQDDRLPYDIMRLIGGDEVTAQNMFFNTISCYGAGVELHSYRDHGPVSDPAIRLWMRRQNLPAWFLNQCTDMKYYFWSVSIIILSRDGSRITRLLHKEACHCRLEEADRRGRIRNIFYADWRTGRPQAVERIPLLDEDDPCGDLLRRMGRMPCRDGSRRRPVRDRKFAILMRYPTVGNLYYPVPYWAAVLRGGSYDEKRMISAAKRAKLKNFSSLRYQVEVHRDYWQRIIDEERISDPVEAKARIRREKQAIRDFVCGIDNADKVWISGYYVDPDGREQRDVRVVAIERKPEGGDWGDDINISANTMCYGFNVHPNLVGAVPGKSQSNNSGSDKRELFTMKQATEKSFHDLLLTPLRTVCEFNGWDDAEPCVPMIQLTTLDRHADAERVVRTAGTPEESGKP